MITLSSEENPIISLTPQEMNRLEPSVRRFAESVFVGLKSFIKAGHIVVEEMAKDPEFHLKVEEQTNGLIPADFVLRMEKLGRGQTIPEMVLYSFKRGVKKLMDSEISPALQEKYYKEGIPVLVSNGETLNVKPQNMTSDQVDQVFERKMIRSVSQQRAFVESQKMNASRKQLEPVQPPYSLAKGKFYVTRPCSFDVKELLEILAKGIKIT